MSASYKETDLLPLLRRIAYSGSCESPLRRNPRAILLAIPCPPAPFCDAPEARGRKEAKTSCANFFRGSCASVSFQRASASTQAIPSVKEKNVPRKIISSRGGYDFLSGTLATS